MINIRRGVFETNSSSTHSISILTEEEDKQWLRGDILRYRWSDKFITKEEYAKKFEELKQQYAKENNIPIEDVDDYDVQEYFYDDIAYNFEDYDDIMELESDVTKYTTKNGEQLIIRCWYGYEG